MGENGTEVLHFIDEEDRFSWMKSISKNDIFNLQDIAEKYKKGDVQKIAHNCREKAVKFFGSIAKAADALGLSDKALKSWGKKTKSNGFRSPKLENILLIAHKTGTEISELLS